MYVRRRVRYIRTREFRTSFPMRGFRGLKLREYAESDVRYAQCRMRFAVFDLPPEMVKRWEAIILPGGYADPIWSVCFVTRRRMYIRRVFDTFVSCFLSTCLGG